MRGGGPRRARADDRAGADDDDTVGGAAPDSVSVRLNARLRGVAPPEMFFKVKFCKAEEVVVGGGAAAVSRFEDFSSFSPMSGPESHFAAQREKRKSFCPAFDVGRLDRGR